mgnify:CR=1 FL=1
MEYSFGLLKPDCIKRDLQEEVFKMIESAGLKIIASKRVRLTREQVAGVWPTCVGEDFYEEMVEFSLSGDSIVFIAEGDNAIDCLSDLVGYHDPAIAKDGTIRKRFATTLTENIAHSTMDEKTFWEETTLFFEVSFH